MVGTLAQTLKRNRSAAPLIAQRRARRQNTKKIHLAQVNFWEHGAFLSAVLTLCYWLTSDQFSKSYDQLRNLAVAQGILNTGVPAFFDWAYWQHPPLLPYLIAGISKFAGLTLFDAGRTVVLAFAFAGLYGFYKLATQVGDGRFAWKATALLGVSPLVWEHANLIFHETGILLFFTWVPYFWMQSVRTRQWKWAAWAGVFIGLGLWMKASMVLLFPLIALIQIALQPDRKLDVRAVKTAVLPLSAATLLAAAVFSPYVYYRVINHAPELGSSILPVLTGQYQWDPHSGWDYYLVNAVQIFSIPVALAGLIGLYPLLREKRPLWTVVLLWALMGLAVASASVHKEPRFIFPALPALMLLAARGVDECAVRLRHERILWGLLICAVTIPTVTTQLQDGHWPADNPTWKMLERLDSHYLLVGDIAPQYLSAGLWTHKSVLFADGNNEDLKTALLANTRYAIYDDNYAPNNMTALQKFPDCHCTLYRIWESNFVGKTVRVVDGEGRPVEGVFLMFIDEKIGYPSLTNSTGQALLRAPSQRVKITAHKICYKPLTLETNAKAVNTLVIQRDESCLEHQMPYDRY